MTSLMNPVSVENAGVASADPTLAPQGSAVEAKIAGGRAPTTVSPLLPADPKSLVDPTLAVTADTAKELPSWHKEIDVHQEKLDKQSKHGFGRFWEAFKERKQAFVDHTRDKTPASVINNGSRINFGLKAIADGMSIASALRPGSRSIPRLIANVPTFLTMFPGVYYKEEPVSKQDQAKYDKMGRLEYIGTKVKQAFDPKHHIVELVALATMWNGAFTTLSGVRQSTFKGVTLKNWTGKVSSEIWQGLMTVVAGAILDFSKDREKAWQLSTSIFLWRIPFKAHQAYTAYYVGYPEKGAAPGDWKQFGNFALQQAANVFGLFFTGIKKTDDGKIIVLGKDEDNVDLSKEHIKGYEFDHTGKDRRQATKADRNILVTGDSEHSAVPASAAQSNAAAPQLAMEKTAAPQETTRGVRRATSYTDRALTEQAARENSESLSVSA